MYPSSCPEPNILGNFKPNNFKFTINRIPSFDRFIQYLDTPSINAGVVEQKGRVNTIYRPGEKLKYGELNVGFSIDAEFKNYNTIYDWLRNNNFPEDNNEYKNIEPFKNNVTDTGILAILGDDGIIVSTTQYLDIFPVFLSGYRVSTTQNIHIALAEVSFRFTLLENV